MTHLYGLNSCFYDNCDKKIIIIKEKEGKRQGKKTLLRRDSNLGPLLQQYGFTTRPRGLYRLHSAKSFYLNRTLPKRFKTCKMFSAKKPEGKVSDRLDYHN